MNLRAAYIAGMLCFCGSIMAASPTDWVEATPQRSYFDDVDRLADTTLLLTPSAETNRLEAIEIRAATAEGCVYRLMWDYSDNGSYWYAEMVTRLNHTDDDVASGSGISISLGLARPETADSVVGSAFKPIDTRRSQDVGVLTATTAVEIDRRAGLVTVYCGDEEPKLVASASCSTAGGGRMGIRAVKGAVDVEILVAEVTADMQRRLATGLTDETIGRLTADEPLGSIEGIWEYLDRDSDLRFARPGGRYRLGIVENNAVGGYDIIYLDGAEASADQWYAGMLKGRLTPTIFQGHYDLRWYDAMFTTHAADCSATLEQPGVLKLSFPLLKNTIRLSKHREPMPTDK